MYLWVRSETINQSSLTLKLDRSRPVFYALPSPSLTDLVVLDRECTKAGLPRPVLPVAVGTLQEPAAFFYLTPDPDWLGRHDKRGARRPWSAWSPPSASTPRKTRRSFRSVCSGADASQ